MVAAIALGMLLTGVVAGCGGDSDVTQLTVGSTDFSEPWILGEMVRILLNEHVPGVEVDHITGLQGSTLTHAGMVGGDLDLYISWTGTQFTGILEMEVTDEWKNPEKVFDYVKSEFESRYGHTWLPPFGFNNTYALAVRSDFAAQHGLETASDLVALAPELVIGVDPTFLERIGDGFDDMSAVYGFNFKNAVDMNYGLMYTAVAAGEVDVIVAYSTDGRVAALDLTILDDNLEFFPPYDGAIVANMDILEEHPEIVQVLEPLFGSIDETVMGALNARVDVDEADYQDVAREYLVQQGLID